MENYKEQLFLIPKGSNGLRLHPRAFIEDSMKSYEKTTGVLLPLQQIQKLEADKAELLSVLGEIVEWWHSGDVDNFIIANLIDKSESLIQKMKQ